MTSHVIVLQLGLASDLNQISTKQKISEMSATTDNNSSKVMSALTAITSLASSLLPNAIDLQQLNQLITSLIRMPTTTEEFMSGPHITSLINGSNIEDHRLEIRREKHRQTERVRHNTIITLIRQLSQMIGFHEENESQAMILNRSARYVLFLSHVIDKLEADSTDDSIDILSDEWLQSLYPLYERSFEEATNLIKNSCEDNDNKSCVSESSQESTEALNRSRDHCIPLISMSFKK